MQLKTSQPNIEDKPSVLVKSSALYCILYIMGIQSVRILKRVKRRLYRFLQPVCASCWNIIARYAERHVEELQKEVHKEIDKIKSGFSIGMHRIQTARAEGIFNGVAEFFKVTGKSFVRHRKVVGIFLNIAAPVAAVIIMVATVHFWTTRDFGLVLAYNGEQIATIQDEQTFEQATELVNARLVSEAEAGENLKLTPRYTLAMADSNHYATPGILCDKLIERSDGVIEDASGLYVDGKLLGAVKSNTDLQFILQSILNSVPVDTADAQVSFTQKVECVDGLYPTGNIISSEEIKEKLTATTRAEKFYTIQAGDTFGEIANRFEMSEDALSSINAVDPECIFEGEQLKVQTAKSFLTVQVTKQETYESEIAYNTVTQSDEDEYTDYSEVTQEGVNGVELCVDKVTYIDGQEAARLPVSRTVKQPAVEKTVLVGTKERSVITGGYVAEEGSGRSSGSLMWPVPYTHTITSPYAMRWGVMHNGIDISAGGIYGQSVLAADGGTVIDVCYSNYGYGNYVMIRHANGLTTRYAHCSALYVSNGQKVSKGQVIAAVGSTGDSTGPHLHFEVAVNGSTTNPLNYVG